MYAFIIRAKFNLRTYQSSSSSVAKKDEPEMDATSKKALADFKSQLAKIVVNNLGKYNKVDCKAGRIMDNSDFKYVARKVHIFDIFLLTCHLVHIY